MPTPVAFARPAWGSGPREGINGIFRFFWSLSQVSSICQLSPDSASAMASDRKKPQGTAGESDWASVAMNARENELERAGGSNFRAETDGAIFARQILAQLLLGNIKAAQLAWKRVPAEGRAVSWLAAVWELGKRLKLRDRAGFYARIRDEKWPENIAPLVTALRATISRKMFALVGRSYSSISLESVAELIGTNTGDAEAAVKKAGWEVRDGVVYPVQDKADTGAQDARLAEMDALSQYAIQLERR